MPKQVSKTVTVMLFDEEVEAWEKLEAYLRQKNPEYWTHTSTQKISTRQMIRDLLRLTLKQFATELGSADLAKKLEAPLPPPGRRPSPARPAKVAQVKLTPKKPPAKKPAPKSTHRIFWDRPLRTRKGGAG